MFEKTPEPTAEQLEEARVREEAQRATERERAGRRAASEFLELVGRRYRESRFSNFEVTDAKQAKVVTALERYTADSTKHIAEGRGVVLFGNAGTGKTHLLAALGARVAYNTHAKIGWIDGPTLFSEARDRISEDGSEAEAIRRFRRYDVLAINDPFPPGGVLTPFQTALLFAIVDGRYVDQRATWVSLNAVSGDEAEQRLGVAITDRLRDDALCLHCCWPSHRKAWPSEV